MENWKPVKDFEGVYEVSDLGRVRRIGKGKGAIVGAVIKAHPQQGGYLIVHLRDAGRDVQRLLHRMVAIAFIPNPLNLPEVNHVGCQSDCRAIKLEWRSRKGNTQFSVKKRPLKGISFIKSCNRWKVSLGRGTPLGYFKTKQEALRVRKAAIEAMPHIL